MDDAGLLEQRLGIENGLLGRSENGVEPSQDDHRENHITVLAAHVQVAQHIVSDPSDEISDPVQICVHLPSSRVDGPMGDIDQRAGLPGNLNRGAGRPTRQGAVDDLAVAHDWRARHQHKLHPV